MKPILPILLVWLAVIAAVILVLGLSGCASEYTTAVCEMKILGQSERGNPVVLQACESPERFREANR